MLEQKIVIFALARSLRDSGDFCLDCEPFRLRSDQEDRPRGAYGIVLDLDGGDDDLIAPDITLRVARHRLDAMLVQHRGQVVDDHHERRRPSAKGGILLPDLPLSRSPFVCQSLKTGVQLTLEIISMFAHHLPSCPIRLIHPATLRVPSSATRTTRG